MKAKKTSLGIIVFAVIWVMALFLAMAFVPVIWEGKTLGIGMTEILASGVFFVVACTPVYRSIWLDKKFGVQKKSIGDSMGTETRGEGDGTC